MSTCPKNGGCFGGSFSRFIAQYVVSKRRRVDDFARGLWSGESGTPGHGRHGIQESVLFLVKGPEFHGRDADKLNNPMEVEESFC